MRNLWTNREKSIFSSHVAHCTKKEAVSLAICTVVFMETIPRYKSTHVELAKHDELISGSVLRERPNGFMLTSVNTG